ncbi:gamma carbonic anhydrase family protein [Kiloniella laminariae]|uniref:Gamma carbonic anhydrase family protein n=1 Tax=Kiloniella laminariae TaxID=454162 RepID=A0ABT4LG60_9PROT|nr:gamma carbonic anhydrase family protein [Kiloniella laminariae]MCZ4280088.1 gamma carbonic anhydrase family protein [Kiloniella laminariae]
MAALILPYRGIFPKISPEAFIAETAVIIGDVEIGPGSSIWYGCVVRGDVNAIRIGRNTNIQDGTIIHVNHDRQGGDYRQTGGGLPTNIGDGVTVGHAALLHACDVRDNAFIGMRAVVMDKAVVQSGAMVAAGALLTPGKTVPTGELWSGSPAKKFRDLSAEEQQGILYSASNYAELGKSYRQPLE